MRKEIAKAKKAGTRKSQSNVAEADRTLWEALRACRKRLSEEEGVPPYVVFHDATLMDMLAIRPRNRMEFSAVSGVGDRKLERYGDEFLAVLNGDSNDESNAVAEDAGPDSNEILTLALANMDPPAIARQQKRERTNRLSSTEPTGGQRQIVIGTGAGPQRRGNRHHPGRPP